MSDESYSLENYVDDLRGMATQIHGDRETISKVHPLARSQYDIEKSLEAPFKAVVP